MIVILVMLFIIYYFYLLLLFFTVILVTFSALFRELAEQISTDFYIAYFIAISMQFTAMK